MVHANTSYGRPLVPFVVGVTGFMEIAPEYEDVVQRRIREVLEWLKDGQLNSFPQNNKRKYIPCLGLKSTPIVLLSSLAPGTDQIAAHLALALGYEVRCPLPFANDIYREASTFGNAKQKLDAYDFILSEVMDQAKKAGLSNEDPPTFHVLRPEDTRKSEDVVFEVLREDLKNRERRNLRYRSAGDFISAHCDVLIAICDMETENQTPDLDTSLPRLAQSGTVNIVQSQLNGLEAGTLPGAITLTWPDNGPVIRIYCPRPDRNASSGNLQPGDVAFWYPKVSDVPYEFEDEWQARKHKELLSYASRIERLNQDLLEIGPANGDQADALLRGKQRYTPKTLFDETLPIIIDFLTRSAETFFIASVFRRLRSSNNESSKQHQQFNLKALSPLRRLASLRRSIADLNAKLDIQVKTTVARNCIAFLLVVLLLQFYDNWNLKTVANWHYWQLFSFVVGVTLVAYSFIRHEMHKHSRLFDRQNDYRSIAEAMRIQFYWGAAGIGQEAATTYLQRARGEISWIRKVVSSSSLSLTSSINSFWSQPRSKRIERLQQVCTGWLGQQVFYFEKASYEQGSRYARVKFFANLFLMSGMILIFSNVYFHGYELENTRSAFELWAKSLHSKWLAWCWALILTGIILGLLLVQLLKYLSFLAYFGLNQRKDDLKQPTLPIAVRLLRIVTASRPYFLFVASCTIAFALVTTAYAIPTTSYVPTSFALLVIFKNMSLAFGGVLHTWATFKFMGENERRYSATREMYRSAKAKMSSLLKELNAQDQMDKESIELTQLEYALQDYLIVLGNEALQENVDWLTMHRNKPIEPILPGA